jgi:hypothetical protein
VRLQPLALVASVALTAALVAAPVQATQATQATQAAPADPGVLSVSTPDAAQALADAQALFAPTVSRLDRGMARAAAPATRDATMVLRQLRLDRDDLSVADRATADRLLARPATNRSRDFDSVRVHWSSDDSDVTSAYVDEVGATAEHVLAVYAAAGYRAPEPDGTRGGNEMLDIYLEDLGSQSLYGYCNGDAAPPVNGPHDTSAYCAFDNDYDEFPSHTSLENLQVTAAHELFHAVQFAYDFHEDRWFMEATATWAEDEVYDDVDDNVQYLTTSPLSQPRDSMDRFSGLWQYGDWIFFRYLTEHYPGAEGELPTLVRDLWERDDGSAGATDDYSVQAIAKELASRGTSLRRVFADFARANRRPGASYEEGAANHYPTAPLAGRRTLSGHQGDSGVLARTVDHLASATLRFTRATGFAASKLRVHVDLPPAYRGSEALVTVAGASGQPQTTALNLSSQGDATKRVGFGSGVKYVEVTLVNASIRYRCGIAPNAGYSCAGRPRDDDLRMAVRARAIR